MERIQEEMVKMSQDERDRYLYLREAMAASDRVSQLQSAENRGVRAGKLLNQISMIQKKVKKNKNLEQIADELEESTTKIRPIYNQVNHFQDDGRSRIRNGLHGRNMWSDHRSRCSHRCHKKLWRHRESSFQSSNL